MAKTDIGAAHLARSARSGLTPEATGEDVRIVLKALSRVGGRARRAHVLPHTVFGGLLQSLIVQYVLRCL
jgi:hypothetical protein